MTRVDEKGEFLRWLHRSSDTAVGTRHDDIDVGLILDSLRRTRYLINDQRAYFRTTVHGWENVPSEPSLIVANHSGGTSVPDAWGLGLSWYREFGIGRPLHTLAHEMVFALKLTADPLSKLGILRANKELAYEVLTNWKRDLLVMPGGDIDTWRPWKERYNVRFSGRKGYVRLALRAGVPIVPIAHAGAHNTLIVLTDGQKIAEKLRLKKMFRASVFPIHLSLPMGLSFGPTPHIPIPMKLRYRVAPPIMPPESLALGEEPDQALVAEVDEAVRTALQRELDQLREESPPVRERVAQVGRAVSERIVKWVR
jgi:1-acyl-sn-glycerol-3-phosphate acyltransferase